MPLLDHPKNVDDLSGDKGFQWKFHCDVCGNGFDTTFIPSRSANSQRRLGFLSSGFSAMGSLTGSGGMYGASQAASGAQQYKNQSAEWHKEHDNAFQQAVNEAKTHFKKCPKCKAFVCDDDWNNQAGLCTTDAPSMASELQAAKAQAAVEQMKAQVASQQQFNGDTSNRSTVCPKCGKTAGSEKFCQNCGTPLAFKECPSCHKQNPVNINFCGECGGRLG